jgi:hypothetical protein
VNIVVYVGIYIYIYIYMDDELGETSNTAIRMSEMFTKILGGRMGGKTCL